MDSQDSFPPPIPIGHRSGQVFRASSRIHIELMCPCVGVHGRRSLISSFLFLQQYTACIVRFAWIICVIGGKRTYRCFFVWCCIFVGCCIFVCCFFFVECCFFVGCCFFLWGRCFQDLFKRERSILE